MSLIDKAYFTLEEIEERWQLPHRDVVYLAENGLLKLSVRLFSVRIEQGYYDELNDGDWTRVPTEQRLVQRPSGPRAARRIPTVPRRSGEHRSICRTR